MTAAPARRRCIWSRPSPPPADLVLGQEAVEDKSSETTAIPVLLQRLAADGGLKGALVSIDAIACNATIRHRHQGTRAPTTCWRSRPTSRR